MIINLIMFEKYLNLYYNIMNNNFKNKYFKYKNKYLTLQNQKGGTLTDDELHQICVYDNNLIRLKNELPNLQSQLKIIEKTPYSKEIHRLHDEKKHEILSNINEYNLYYEAKINLKYKYLFNLL
jgi:hypothetical protein